MHFNMLLNMWNLQYESRIDPRTRWSPDDSFVDEVVLTQSPRDLRYDDDPYATYKPRSETQHTSVRPSFEHKSDRWR